MRFLPISTTPLRRNGLACLAALLFFAATLPPASSTAHAQETVIDEIAAVVGNSIILRSDVSGVTLSYVQQQQLDYSPELWSQALDDLISQKVVAYHADIDTTIIVTDEQITQAIDRRIAALSSQAGGEERLEEAYGKPVYEIKEELRGDFRDQILADQLRSRKLQQIRITPTEVDRWFSKFPADSLPVLPETVRLAHIVRYPVITPEGRRDAEDIIARLRDSVNVGSYTFEMAAESFSEDPGSANNGGRYTDIPLSQYAPEFAAMASRMSETPGVVSPVFETEFGLHILRVNQRRGDVVDLNHILIKFDESKADASGAIALLETVRDSLLSGVPFAQLAQRHSQERTSSTNGGRVVDPRSQQRDLPLEALGPTWQSTLDTLEVGEVSEPAPVNLLDGRRAYHIVKLQQRVPEHTIGLERDYERIEQLALQDKQQRMIAEWVQTLRREVYVDVRIQEPPLSLTSN